ncbi:MAG: tRNA (guanosine(46)-N7)-methyltransferase TrmB [Betaproteobacteria bacterium]|nr:tRNA (guanosine(46)-N7)-methyltransferase TrmB [Betaproteobacteria bacterium]
MEENKKIRPIRSYVLRQGRLTKHQAEAISLYGNDLIIPSSNDLINWDRLFSSKEKRSILEIGFGMGDTTAEIAKRVPQNNYIGIEVHSPGVGSLINKIKAYNLNNLRIIQHDAVEVVENMFANESLDAVHIFFPDPWHKKRHNKRRLIRAEFLRKVATKLKKNAYLHIATDWEDYALWIIEEFKVCKEYALKTNEFQIKPDHRPYTKYEKRGLNLGHNVWDIVFMRI